MNLIPIIKMAFEAGGLYFALIALLIITIFYLVKRYRNNDNGLASLEEKIGKMSDKFDKISKSTGKNGYNFKETSDSILRLQIEVCEIGEHVDKLSEFYMNSIKDMVNTQNNMYDKVKENYMIIKNVDDNVKSLQYQISALLANINNNNNTRTIDKGL